MKINTLTLLIVLSLLITGCSSGKGKITTGENKSGEIIAKVENNPDRTKTRTFYRGDKEIAKQTEDKDGALIATEGIIPDGIIREYYKSGKLMEETHYKNGKREGKSTWYYETGVIKGERNYKEHKLEGIIKWYYATGSLGTEFNYKNGKLEGVTKLYWENGNVKAEHYYENGKREGINKQYYTTGELRYIYIFEKGKRISKKAYSTSGKFLSEQIYK